MCTQKMRALTYIGAKKITFPPRPDIHTDRHTDRQTDISVYRVDSLLKIKISNVNPEHSSKCCPQTFGPEI